MHHPYAIFEGVDSSGKDSQCDLLVRYLVSLGLDPLRVAEPDNELPTGQLLRQLLRSGDLKESHAALFLADRMAVQTRKIAPALKKGRPIVSSRSFLSTLVYQQEVGYPLDWLLSLHTQLPVKPDLVFILDLPASVAAERMRLRGLQQEYYEAVEIQTRNRDRYLDIASKLDPFLAPKGMVVVLDADDTRENIHNDVVAVFQRWMSRRD
jgi:dTMP kinase